MSKIFKSVKSIRQRRNPFDLSFESAITTEFGRLTPILCQECVPNDTFRISTQALIRMAPMFAPAFSRCNAYMHYFFIPHRLINDDFETFITGGEDGEGTIKTRYGLERKALRPWLSAEILYSLIDTLDDAGLVARFKKAFGKGSLFDYFGYPTYEFEETNDSTLFFNNFSQPIDITPFIAFAMLWNEYYRDQNFQAEIDLVKDCQGEICSYLTTQLVNQERKVVEMVLSLLEIKQRNWEKDYFTSALPWPQRGGDTTIGEVSGSINPKMDGSDPESQDFDVQRGDPDYVNIGADDIAGLIEFKGGQATSVNEFRRAIAIQKLKEAEARFGSRFFEYIRGFFGVKVQDARLQRPEFIGGSRIPIQFGEVLQTSETNITPQGTYAGRGVGAGVTKPKKYHVKEHGWLIGVLSIMPKPFYAQGWPRKFTRIDRFDFYNPLFAHLGEQEVLQKELIYMYDGYDSTEYTRDELIEVNNRLFGYQARFAEMRYNSSEVHGDFRSSLKDWHTARVLDPAPSQQGSILNASFLAVDNESANRIFNYRRGDYDHFWINLYHDIKAIRPLPKFGTPLI